MQTVDVEQSIPNRFEAIVSAAASNVAIRSAGRSTTYEALNRAADAVASSLLRLRGNAAEPIGLLLGQEDRAISAVLGVLKAGKFYVPLDASYPAERLSFILTDCAARLVITDREHATRAQALAPAGCAIVQAEDLDTNGGDPNPGLSISPHALAALFYTSGSTGRPKGVIQTHRLVLHRVMLDTNDFAITVDDRLSLLSSPGYSTSLRPLFGALLNGAVVCPFNLGVRGFAELAAWIRAERITIYASVPAVFRRFVASLNGGDGLDALRIVHLGGDTVTAGDLALHRTHLPPRCQFVTSFASNETGQVRRFVANAETQLSTDLIPLGFAVQDKEVLILDDEGRPLGPTQVGEIVVRSEFLSPGYWHQPELTAAAFGPDPQDPVKRIYHTGDLGVLLPDNCLHYKGRKDSRVKIRGIRVEIGDVEAALRSHPSIERTVVLARETRPGQPALVAYVQARPRANLAASDIRRFLNSRLPDCMVPSTVVFLDEFPLSPHGKIERLALPVPDNRRPQLETPFVEPRDPTERALAAACESIVGVHPIGTRDNLFDLGADSLALLQLTAHIEAEFGTNLPPSAIFASSTIADLAALLRSPALPQRWSLVVPIQANGARPPFFWIHGGRSTHVLSRIFGPDQPVYGVEHQSEDGTRARYTRVETMAAYYVKEIRQVQPSGPFFLGGFSFGAIIAFEAAQQLTAAGEQVELLALLDPPSLAWNNAPDPQPFADAPLDARLRRHARVLSRLSLRERVGYVGFVVKDRAADRFGLPHVSIKPMLMRTALAFGMRLPVFLRSTYIFTVYGRALREYVPRRYAGPALLLKGDTRTYRLNADWPQLLTGPSQLLTVEAEHLQMPDGRYIPLWAEPLKGALVEAQQRACNALALPPV